MILSRTLEGPPNLSLMTLETPKISPTYDPIGLLEDLKKTPLYHPELEQWIYSLEERQIIYTEDQLLGIFALSELGQCPIKESYEKLKDTPFYIEEEKRWTVGIDRLQIAGAVSSDAGVALLDILLLSKFDKKAARDSYENLKNTSLYDEKLDRWNCDSEQREQFHFSCNHLLGIMVLSEFDLNAGRESYLKLQDTVLYDKEFKQWNYYMTSEQVLEITDRYAHDQLLDVLVLSNFDVEEARNTYEKLKNTPLYNKEQRHWARSINKEQQLQSSYLDCHCQLFAVLVEAKLAKAFPPETSLSENLPALPDIWRAK